MYLAANDFGGCVRLDKSRSGGFGIYLVMMICLVTKVLDISRARELEQQG